MPYADTDFFLALLKEKDWLRNNAIKLLNSNKDDITTSVTTIIELLLLAKRFSIDPERLLTSTFAITSAIKGIDKNTALVAAHYIKEKNFNAFDALHAAYCEQESIISSDKIFETVGIKRIRLEGV